MKYIYLIAIAVFATACNGSVRGSKNIISETRTVSTFSSVKVSTSIDVEVQQGTTKEVRVEADDNIIKLIETNVVDGELRINLKSNYGTNNATMKVYVTSPVYSAFTSSSSSEIIGKGTIANTNKISLSANSSSNIELTLDAPTIELEASSSADITVSGKAKNVKAEASSSATIKATTLYAEMVNAEVSSSADVYVFASVYLTATANSSGDITYTGGATNVMKKESSSGSVIKQ
jgi:outer membrane lipopolysaccharide assembly protein LptE/RlpB